MNTPSDLTVTPHYGDDYSSHAPLQPLDMSTAETLHYVMSAVVGPIVCIIGVVGNVLSAVVWTRPGMWGTTGLYLTCQAVAGVGVLIMFLLCDSLQAWAPSLTYSPLYGQLFSYVSYPLYYVTGVLCVWITVGVTVDRYVMVCWITKAKSLCTEGRAKLSLTLITIAVFLVNIPNFFYYTPATSNTSNGSNMDNYNNSNGSYMDNYNSSNGINMDNYNSSNGSYMTSYNSNNCSNMTSYNSSSETTAGTSEKQPGYRLSVFGGSQWGFTYEFWIHCIVVLLVPWFSVFYMNLMIIFQITRANKQMADKKTAHSLERSKQSENQITRILLSATFSFIIFMGVQCVAQCYWMQKPKNADWRIVSSAFAFGKTGIVFTSALNFIFFCLTGRRFRTELLKTLGFSSKSLKYSSQSDSPTSSIQHTSVPTD